MKDQQAVLMPREVSSRVGFFDRSAGVAANLASRAPFFACCLLLVIIWLAQGVVLVISKGSLHGFLDAQYQLEINTTTTIITFLMVALLQNSRRIRPATRNAAVRGLDAAEVAQRHEPPFQGDLLVRAPSRPGRASARLLMF